MIAVNIAAYNHYPYHTFPVVICQNICYTFFDAEVTYK